MTEAASVSVAVRPRWRRWGRRALKACVCAAIIGVVACAGWEVALRVAPYPAGLARYPRGATVVEDREGHELAAFVGQEDAWYMPLESGEISPHLKQAIVAVEDRRFFEHGGVDWRSVAGAARQDVTGLRIRRGASTIDMQVHRLRDPRPRGWMNKIEQAFRGTQLDRVSSKDSILTEYINRAPFGGNLVGAGAASWRYFGKPCSALSLGQAALLAGLPQSPNRFRPDRGPEKARQRREHVLSQMVAAGMITRGEFERANAEPIEAAWRPLPQDGNRRAWGALPAVAAVAGRAPGRRVRTTIDGAMQAAAFEAASGHLKEIGGADSAAVVVLDVATGEIRATVSMSSATPAVDLARAPRSTGSVLKPFVYASAFEMGILSPGSDVLDSPKAWAGYVPTNFDRGFRGRMTAAEALAESRNIPAMVVLSKVGVERAVGTLREVGIRTPGSLSRKVGLSLAIGGAEASVLEVAEGYATLARGGLFLPARLTARDTEATRVFPERVCWQTLGCINGRARTEGVDGGAAAAERGTAWKTGTSNGLRDAWCAAVTPRLAVVVWLGNSAGRGDAALVGQEAAAPLALKLIGAFDAGGAGFPRGDGAGKTPVLAVNSGLSIVTPAPGTEFVVEEGASQRIALKCDGGAGKQRWWFANGSLVGTSGSGEIAWWAAAGKYELRVVDESGHGREVSVRVR